MKILIDLEHIPTDTYLLLGRTEFLRQFPSLEDEVFEVFEVFEIILIGLVILSDANLNLSRVEFSE